jgi:hypothetical protein
MKIKIKIKRLLCLIGIHDLFDTNWLTECKKYNMVQCKICLKYFKKRVKIKPKFEDNESCKNCDVRYPNITCSACGVFIKHGGMDDKFYQ